MYEQQYPQEDLLRNSNEPYQSEGVMQLPINQSQDPKIVEMIINLPRTLLEELEHDLKGEIPNEDGNWVKKKTQVINDKGVDELVALLKIPFSPANSLSFLDEEMILKEARDFHISITLLLRLHFQDWGIDRKNVSFISKSIGKLYLNILMMSKNAKYLNSLTQTFKTTEIMKSFPENQGQGVFSRMGRKFSNWRF